MPGNCGRLWGQRCRLKRRGGRIWVILRTREGPGRASLWGRRSGLELTGEETELHRVGHGYSKNEGDDGPCGVAETLANGLDNDDQEKQRQGQDETVGYEVMRAGCS